eukprot:scaffold9087_cov119-Isochrysis_galbana.AAC.1
MAFAGRCCAGVLVGVLGCLRARLLTGLDRLGPGPRVGVNGSRHSRRPPPCPGPVHALPFGLLETQQAAIVRIYLSATLAR